MTPVEARRILGLSADDDDLRAAFRRSARRYHPDAPEGDATRFRATVAAFTLLASVPAAVEPHSHGAASDGRAARRPPPSGRRDLPAAAGFGSSRGGSHRTPAVPIDVLVRGLDAVGEVTYVDRSAALIEGVITHTGAAVQVLLSGTGAAGGRVVDAVRLDGRPAPDVGEVEQRLIAAASVADH